MALSIRDIKRRMKSVKNTGQITHAMEAVSATKMRKAQVVALQARPYALKALELLERISASGGDGVIHPLLEKRHVERVVVLLVTSDKGLCGILNHNTLKRFDEFMNTLSFPSHNAPIPPLNLRGGEGELEDDKVDFIAVGNYGARYLRRKGYAVLQEFAGTGDTAKLDESRPTADLVLKIYEEHCCDVVYVVYTDFVSTLKQSAVVRQVLPLTKEIIGEVAKLESGIRNQPFDIAQGRESRMREKDAGAVESKLLAGKYFFEYKFEPSPAEVLNQILPSLVRVRIHQIILESNASEHSARMIAMKNASDNASELLETLRLSFNKARQAGITREIAEITGGAAALEA